MLKWTVALEFDDVDAKEMSGFEDKSLRDCSVITAS